MEAADSPPGAEIEIGIKVQERLAVADDALADARRHQALIGTAAGAIEGDAERRPIALRGERTARQPCGLALSKRRRAPSSIVPGLLAGEGAASALITASRSALLVSMPGA